MIFIRTLFIFIVLADLKFHRHRFAFKAPRVENVIRVHAIAIKIVPCVYRPPPRRRSPPSAVPPPRRRVVVVVDYHISNTVRMVYCNAHLTAIQTVAFNMTPIAIN